MVRAELLGAIFDVLVFALAAKEFVTVKNPPRMADFAYWGTAIAQALDFPGGSFLVAYRKNISGQNAQVLEDNEVAQAIQMFIADCKDRVWLGTPTQLYKALKSFVGVADSPSWPKSAPTFMKDVNIIKTNLADIGIKITQSKTGSRLITIEKTDQYAAAAALALPDAKPNL